MTAPPVRLSWTEGADTTQPLPCYETPGAAGADLRANLPADSRAQGVTLAPMQRALVSTGLHMALPEGYEAQVRPRSGLALKHGVTVLNTPGTIDSDYRGILGVVLINLGADPVTIAHGERIAQMVIAPVVQARFEAVGELDTTPRGSGGFGSTGRA